MAAKNYIKLNDFSLFNVNYCFLDLPDYLADQIFIQNKLEVKFGKHFQNPAEPYMMIFCKVKKRDEELFLKSMEELSRKMMLLGHTDYEEYCEGFIPMYEAMAQSGI